MPNGSFPRQEILRRKQEKPITLWLVSNEDVKQHGVKPGKVMDESFFEKAHCITDNRCIRNGEPFPAMTMNEFKNQPFSIFLPKDHDLDPSIQMCIVDAETNAMIFSLGFFATFTSEERLNPFPYYFAPRPHPPEADKGLYVQSCSESKNQFEVDFGLREVVIDGPDGNKI